MAKKQSKKVDAVGWKFWAIAFVVLLGPAIYGMARIVRADTKYFVIAFMGMLVAGAASAVVTWLANTMLQWVRRFNHKPQKHHR